MSAARIAIAIAACIALAHGADEERSGARKPAEPERRRALHTVKPKLTARRPIIRSHPAPVKRLPIGGRKPVLVSPIAPSELGVLHPRPRPAAITGTGNPSNHNSAIDGRLIHRKP